MKNTLFFLLLLMQATAFAQPENTDSGDEGDFLHNRFYATFEDYIDKKPVTDLRVETGSFVAGTFGNNNFKLVDKAGKAKRTNTKNFPAKLFSYQYAMGTGYYLVRVIDGEPYLYLSAGKLCFYAQLSNQERRYTSEGVDGELKKFSDKYFEGFLKEANLLETYKKDKPKREFRDTPNSYFNKYLTCQATYLLK